MNLTGVPANPYASVASAASSQTAKPAIGESAHAALLRKLMEAQRQEAEQSMRLSGGKGQVLDIRV